MQDTEKRFIELEEKIAFQEDVIQKLDDSLAIQQKQLMQAEHKISMLIEQQKKLESNLPAPSDERPPHY
ncbi:MAG: SlyX family protein [Gammaproteobacteria bacterium]|jgi:SlyX protein|nr:SlyX family protein [Gammaproteobacteria bacterium]MBT4493138.1 SlyX family protein [Gammaproteobacteria bacterium]MBT7372221.1 SlyX family protein [Gammaproteobacteria bacterium]